MREDFEAWAVSEAARMQYSFPSEVVQINGRGDYAIVWVQGAWLGWQASRAAVVVELPNRKTFPDSLTDAEFFQNSEFNLSRLLCSRAIESTGIRVK